MPGDLTQREVLDRLAGDRRLSPGGIEVSIVEDTEALLGRSLAARVRVCAAGMVIQFHARIATLGTPKEVAKAARIAREFCAGLPDTHPLVLAPHLPDSQLQSLTELGVSGLDIVGNAALIAPPAVYFLRSGRLPAGPAKARRINPFAGLTSLVIRLLMAEPFVPSQAHLLRRVQLRGGALDASTTSLALGQLQREGIVARYGRSIRFIAAPEEMLNRLAATYKPMKPLETRLYRYPEDISADFPASRYGLSRFSWWPRRSMPDLERRLPLFVAERAPGRPPRGGLIDSPEFEPVDDETHANLAWAIVGRRELLFDLRRGPAPGVKCNTVRPPPIQIWLELQAGGDRREEADSLFAEICRETRARQKATSSKLPDNANSERIQGPDPQTAL